MKYLLTLIYCSFLYANNNQIIDSSFSFIFETDSIIVGQDSVGSFEGTLYNLSNNEINLEIIGLMAIPPNDNNAEKYFKSLNELNKSLALENLSMGMSADYEKAVKNESNFVRIGSSIFGSRL